MPGTRKLIFSRLDDSSTGNGPVVRVRVATLTCHHRARGLLRYSMWLSPFPDVVNDQGYAVAPRARRVSYSQAGT